VEIPLTIYHNMIINNDTDSFPSSHMEAMEMEFSMSESKHSTIPSPIAQQNQYTAPSSKGLPHLQQKHNIAKVANAKGRHKLAHSIILNASKSTIAHKLSYDRKITLKYDEITTRCRTNRTMASYESCRTVVLFIVLLKKCCRTTPCTTKMHCRTVKYDGSSYEFQPSCEISSYSYNSLWLFRPSYDCILHSYDDFRTIVCVSLCRCLWLVR
jgi:hypothetical protein